MDSHEIMEREIAEIIKDIARNDPVQANAQYGPYAGVFDYMRRHLLQAPFDLRLDDPVPFVRKLSEAESAEDAVRYLTREIVLSHFRRERDRHPTGRGWWDRIIAIVSNPPPQAVV